MYRRKTVFTLIMYSLYAKKTNMGERTALLVLEMQEWAKAHKVKHKELAKMLGITPQGMTEIFKGRNQPTGEQVLVMLELLKRPGSMRP